MAAKQLRSDEEARRTIPVPREYACQRRKGHPGPQGPECGSGQGVRRAYHHQGWHDGAGDGTSTATGLAESIVREAMMKNVTPDAKPKAVKWGIDKAVEAVVGERTPRAKPTAGKKEIAQGATISANVVQH